MPILREKVRFSEHGNIQAVYRNKLIFFSQNVVRFTQMLGLIEQKHFSTCFTCRTSCCSVLELGLLQVLTTLNPRPMTLSV